MGAIPDWLLRHQVLIEPLTGEGPFGPEYGEQVAVRCFVDAKRRLVRDAEGAEVISETTIFMPLDTTCPAGSRVVIGDRASTVITAARRDGGGLPVPDHLEVVLQ
ncbi:hypothetical protein ACFYY8_06265 [Streptosporangium sp. NPDC001559]|uniref:hypothetical protein n=1 Tax=Streptosporangium sp. NPDC001559 TaxID=3366187 RepID=UPI0036EE169A